MRWRKLIATPSIVMDGANGIIGSLAIQALYQLLTGSITPLASDKPTLPLPIVALGTVGPDEFYAMLQGKLRQTVLENGTKQREITPEVSFHQPHVFSETMILRANSIFTIVTEDSKKPILTIRYEKIGHTTSREIRVQTAKAHGAIVYVTNTGEFKKGNDVLEMGQLIQQHNMALLCSHPIEKKESKPPEIAKKLAITATRNFSETGTLFNIGFHSKHKINFDHFNRAIKLLAQNESLKPFVQIEKTGKKTAKEVVGQPSLLHLGLDTLQYHESAKLITCKVWEDNQWGYAVMHAQNTLALYLSMMASPNVAIQLAATNIITNTPAIHGVSQLIATKGSVFSSSSCTTNGNMAAILVLGATLYFSRNATIQDDQIKLASLSELQRLAIQMVDEQITLLTVAMEHGKTPSEKPSETPDLRIVSSGSQKEVPAILSKLTSAHKKTAA